MGTRLKVGSAANLVEFWRDSIAECLNADLAELPEEQRFVVNCASQVRSRHAGGRNAGMHSEI